MDLKKKIKLKEKRKKELLTAAVFPLFALMIICAPKGLFPNYTLLGVNKSFLSPALFLMADLLVCYVVGIGFISCSRCREKGGNLTDIYNARLLILTSLFFLHIWILLFIFAMSLFTGGVCIIMALVFALCTLLPLSKCGGVPFFSSVVLSVWTLSLLFWNLGVLFA